LKREYERAKHNTLKVNKTRAVDILLALTCFAKSGLEVLRMGTRQPILSLEQSQWGGWKFC
jgi:hypothetical protein